jgi:hypothetical protein
MSSQRMTNIGMESDGDTVAERSDVDFRLLMSLAKKERWCKAATESDRYQTWKG